jgi:hypothetical protein
MRKQLVSFLVFGFIAQSLPATTQASAQATKNLYPTMAPLAQYLMSDQNAEIALARTAAPKSISDAADIMVLTRNGYTTVRKGSNGFVCMVQRGWSASTDFPEFWNPKLSAPICFDPVSARTYMKLILMKTTLVLEGKPKAEITQAVKSALDRKEIAPTAPGAMSYMMSKHQYLNDQARMWHPHLMFLMPGHVATSWGANLPGSPVESQDDPEERITFFYVLMDHWSDGTPAPQATH